MKDEKDFKVEIEDNQEELITKKEKKQKGFGKYCIFAGALVLFGTVAGISISKHNTYDNDSASIVSTNSDDNRKIINYYKVVEYREEPVYNLDGTSTIIPIAYEKIIPIYEDDILESSIEFEHLSKTK